ncbi:MAG: sulfatase [Candidatus Aminicenantes bacterium]|nr:sulfatase [Candidatus Aminicenantes bacterium]
MRQNIVICIVAAVCLFSQTCVRESSSPFEIFRFIDELKTENITVSPYFNPSELNQAPNQIFPAKSFPLLDMGSGENPFLLKRKIKVWREQLNALFAPPHSCYDFQVSIKEDAVLEFGIGVISDQNTKKMKLIKEGEEKGVRFSVLIEFNGIQSILFEETLSIPSMEERQVHMQKTLDLSSYQGTVRLSFETSGEKGAFSFWTNPLIYPNEKSLSQIILISIDTLRADHLGVYGYERETSPNIDSLAADSAMFSNVYASSPWTLSSHVSILTALNSVNHQVYQDNEIMDPDLVTAAEMLRVNDYFCSAFTGGGFVSSVFGFAYGFDSYYERTDEVLLNIAAELSFRDVARWIDINKNKNYFLFIHTYQPHDPYSSPAPYKTMFLSENSKWSNINLNGHLGGKNSIFKKLPEDDRQNIIDLYDAEIRYTDEKLIGPLVQKLIDMTLYDKTMIIFTSDHGEEFYEHEGWGHGHSLYDESLKVPLLIKFPHSKYLGSKVDHIVSLIDIVPTILDEMDIDSTQFEFDGRSLIPFLEGKEKKDRVFLSDVGENILNLHLPQKIASNEGGKKLILNKSIRSQDRGFFRYPPPSIKAIELFNLSLDPGEHSNIVDVESSIANRIIDRIEEIYKSAKRKKPGQAVLDEELKKQLRALGYIK